MRESRCRLKPVAALVLAFGFIVAFWVIYQHSLTIPPEVRAIQQSELIGWFGIADELTADLDGDGHADKLFLHPPYTSAHKFLRVRWGDGRGSETIGRVVGDDFDMKQRFFVADMDGDGRKEAVAPVLTVQQQMALTVWRFDNQTRKMRPMGTMPFGIGTMQVLDVDGNGCEEIVSLSQNVTISHGYWDWQTITLTVQVVWWDGKRIQDGQNRFIVFKSLLPPPVTVMRMEQYVHGKVLSVKGHRFFIAPFFADVLSIHLSEGGLLSCELDKPYAAVLEVKTPDPNGWRFVGRVGLR